MTIAFVQAPAVFQSDAGTPGGAGALVANAFASANTLGNCLFAATLVEAAAINVTGITDTNGNTNWGLARLFSDATTGYALEIWACPNCKAGSGNVVTAQLSGNNTYVRIGVAEFSGVATSSPVDGSVGGDNSTLTTTTAPTANNITPSQNGDLLLGLIGLYNGGKTISAANSFTSLGTNADGDMQWQYFIQGTAASYACNWSLNAADAYAATYVAIKAASGATAPKKPRGSTSTARKNPARAARRAFIAHTAKRTGQVGGSMKKPWAKIPKGAVKRAAQIVQAHRTNRAKKVPIKGVAAVLGYLRKMKPWASTNAQRDAVQFRAELRRKVIGRRNKFGAAVAGRIITRIVRVSKQGRAVLFRVLKPPQGVIFATFGIGRPVQPYVRAKISTAAIRAATTIARRRSKVLGKRAKAGIASALGYLRRARVTAGVLVQRDMHAFRAEQRRKVIVRLFNKGVVLTAGYLRRIFPLATTASQRDAVQFRAELRRKVVGRRATLGTTMAATVRRVAQSIAHQGTAILARARHRKRVIRPKKIPLGVALGYLRRARATVVRSGTRPNRRARPPMIGAKRTIGSVVASVFYAVRETVTRLITLGTRTKR